MRFYKKTRRGFSAILTKLTKSFLIFAVVLTIGVFLISKIELSTPNKIIKQKIPNEKFKVIK